MPAAATVAARTASRPAHLPASSRLRPRLLRERSKQPPRGRGLAPPRRLSGAAPSLRRARQPLATPLLRLPDGLRRSKGDADGASGICKQTNALFRFREVMHRRVTIQEQSQA